MRFLLCIIAISCTNLEREKDWNPVDVEFHCDRIYAVKRLKEGKQLFFIDSGGGLSPFIFKPNFGAWKTESPKYMTFSEEDGHYVLAKTSIPKTVKIGFYPDNKYNNGLKVVDCKSENRNEFCFLKRFMKDGFIGADWYADKVWKLDYTNRIVSYSLKKQSFKNSEKISFKSVDGKRTTHQPTLSIEIDGNKYFMLFDTGATSNFTDEAQSVIGIKDQFCASSFIRSSTFDTLKKKNPQWNVVKGGDLFGGGSDLLKVPRVKVGGHEIGPIWFAKRKDSIYDNYSKKYVDRNIDGAVGGNVFKYFTVTIDYINEQIQFQK